MIGLPILYRKDFMAPILPSLESFSLEKSSCHDLVKDYQAGTEAASILMVTTSEASSSPT